MMILREESLGLIYFLPLESHEKLFQKDINGFKIFLKTAVSADKNIENVAKRLLTAINMASSYRYPLYVFKKEDLIFIRDVLKSMVSKKINKILGHMNKKKAVNQGILYLNSLIGDIN